MSICFLTGFDNPLLNTLYVDKNLQYHGLIQAFSRTNRIDNVKKHREILSVLEILKKRVDEAVRLFSDTNATGYVITLPYSEYVEKFNSCANRLFKS